MYVVTDEVDAATRPSWAQTAAERLGRFLQHVALQDRQATARWPTYERVQIDSLAGGAHMLRDTDAVAPLAVKDLRAAARFHEQTLGLSRAGSEDNESLVFESGDTRINVYRLDVAGTNRATALTWMVDDVEDVVRTLQAKGVKWQHPQRCQSLVRRGRGVHVRVHHRV
jgi:hypothetical protein